MLLTDKSVVVGAGRLGLRPPRERYDPRVVPWWRTRILLGLGSIVVSIAVLGALVSSIRGWLVALAAVLAILGTATAALLPLWWYRVGRWEVTDHAVYTRTGYVLTTWRIVPLSRIQTLDTTRGPLQRRFGLTTVVVTTASSAGAVRIAGLDEELAADLVHRLAQVTHAIPGDAT